MRKQLLLLLELAISLAITLAVLYFVDYEKVVEVLLRSNPFFILAAFLAYIGINLGMSQRIRIILAEMGHRIPLRSALLANFAGMLVSDFTPARSGYFATAFVLTANEGVPLDKSIVSILGPQMFDFMVKVGGGTLALIYILQVLSPGEVSLVGMLLGILLLAAMLAFGVLLLFSKRFFRLLSFIERLPFGKSAYSQLARIQHNALAVKRVIWAILILLAITWGLKGLEWYLLALGVGVSVSVPFHPYLFYLFLQPLVTMLQFIPTPTLAGMGLSEAGTVAILSLFGVPFYEGFAFAILTRSLMIAVDLVGIQEARKVIRRNLDRLF